MVDLLIREDLSTELAATTRVLAHAGALGDDARITALAGEVAYIAGRGVSNRRMTPYDVIAVRLADGEVLRGEAPEDIERYLAAHRARRLAKSVAIAVDGTILTGLSLRACATATLLRARADLTWDEAASQAKASGALVGVEPYEEPA